MADHIAVYTYPYELTSEDRLSDGPVAMGGGQFKLTDNTLLIWVDLQPGARFAHPTAYVLIAPDSVRVEKGAWWPELNGRRILYGEHNPIGVPSPFRVRNVRLSGHAEKFAKSPTAARPVHRVDAVHLLITESDPPRLAITAYGQVLTSAWTNPRLVPRTGVEPPPDGIWELCFQADPPGGVVLDILQPLVATYVHEGDFSAWEAVRVVAETNHLLKPIAEAKQS